MDEITDIHLCMADLAKSLVFPGPVRIASGLMNLAQELASRTDPIVKDDFMVTVGDYFFRGRRDRQGVDGVWLRLRRMACTPPALDALPAPLPAFIRRMMCSPHLLGGGLVYVIGGPGSGKTTTCAASVVSRLREFGGYGYTVEDPPEMPLNGWHGKGYCAQTWVSGERSAEWQEAFRGVLRSQPTSTHCILFVGEVRDGDSARALIRAASSGFLVFATGFGTDIPAALDSLVRLAAGEGESKAMQESLAGVLRVVLHQRLGEGGVMMVRCLASAHARTAIAVKIREGRLAQLEGDIQFQGNQNMLGVDVFADQTHHRAA